MSVEPATVDDGPAQAVQTLAEQRRAWESRPLVRRLYTGWYQLIAARLAPVPGPTVEVGSGCGTFKEFMPATIATDVFATPWADRIADAERLPFADGELANLVMIDVLHHVQRPAAALAEAERTLAPGGRLIMVEPYCSPLSAFGYRRFHHEPLDLTADPDARAVASSDDPFDANIALPTLIFWRRPELLERWAPALRAIERRRLAWLAYPLSGGFTGRRLLPEWLAGAALAIERGLGPVLCPLAAFRCLVVVERDVAVT